jgi:hypothetical protein
MPAVAADAVADSGAPTRMALETTIMVPSPAFLIWAEQDERAKNCAIWGNPCGNYCSAVPLTRYLHMRPLLIEEVGEVAIGPHASCFGKARATDAA